MAQRKREEARLEIQSQLDAQKTQKERNRLGQFATPTALALEILNYAMTLLDFPVPVRFLDPAIGTGAFYSALLQTAPVERIATATGFEIDPHYGGPSRKLWSDTSLQLHLTDFTQAIPPPTDSERATLLISNPPYVRHHHLKVEEKTRLGALGERITGRRLNGLSGLYCYFLLIAHQWMARNAIAGWLVPSEFMDVKYGDQVKRYLLENVTLLRIHRFDPDKVQFDDALVSSAVVWIRNAPPPTGHHVSFTFGGSLLQPQVARDVSVDSLRNTPKWTRFSSIDDVHRCGEPGRLVLSDLFKIQRGVATGANDFFLLTPERVAEYQIPAQFLKPILPSPRFLLSDEIQSGEDGLPLVERPLFLLSCDLPESLVESEYPSLWKYFQYGVELGISKRYLATHRSPWYAQEERRPAPFLCTYMGRTANGRAFRFILNHSRAIAANVYLLLYPRPVLHQQLADVVVRRNVWRALNAITPEHIIGEGRVYGGGLHKIEPRELGNASADDIVAVIPGLRIPTSKQTSLFHV